MTDGNTYAINKYLDEREDWCALQEVTAELEQAEARIEELEAKLNEMAKVLVEAMVVPEAWMVAGFPNMSSEAREQITASVMKARTTITELKGQNDE